MIRCCLCHRLRPAPHRERTDLPGTGWRCTDHLGCKRKVREIVKAHADLAAALESPTC